MGLFTKSFEILDDDLLAIVKSLLKSAEPRDTVFLVSPYWQMNANLRAAIKEAANDGVRVKCIMRANEKLSTEDSEFFRSTRLEVRALPHLHAKLYVNEDEAVVASMNLYNYSDKESIELGVLIRNKAELEYLRERASQWWDEAKSISLESSSNAFSQKSKEPSASSGFCIRCGKPKSFNAKYPHCDDCYKIWAEYQKDTYPEKHCHKCGAQVKTTKRDPICRNCGVAK